MPLWLSPQPLVLASKSDVRGKMLAAVGLRFEIRPAQIDERAVEAKAGTTDAAAAARLLARAKAEAVARTLPGRLVLGADQTLARGAKRFSKPANRAAAAEQLRSLARAHARAAFRAGAGARRRRAVRLRRQRAADHAQYFRPLSRGLSRHGGRRRLGERRRLSARRHRHSSVRARRGRLFHHSRPAAVAAARLICGRTDLWTADGGNIGCSSSA